MTSRDLQFALRKNPDSSRVHGLRVEVSGPPNAERKEIRSGQAAPPGNAARMQTGFELPLGNVPMGATGGRREDSGRLLTVEEVAALLHVPVSWVYGRMRKRSLERLPAYRLGKYWRFREHEIHAWVNRQCGGGRSA